MLFGLKNVGQPTKGPWITIFHDLISKLIEVYINNVMEKIKLHGKHFGILVQAFEQMWRSKLKLDPLKFAFDVSTRNFLGFLIH